VKVDWESWNRRSLADDDIVRLILDGTVVKVRLDRKATNISLLVLLGVRRDGQKLLLAVKNMGGESEAAWRGVLDDLIARGLRTPELLLIDGGSGLEQALASLWPDVPTQRCTLYSVTKGQQAIRELTRAMLESTGNLPPLPAIFPDSLAPVVRNASDGERELSMMHWGMPGPLQLRGAPATNIRNTASPYWW